MIVAFLMLVSVGFFAPKHALASVSSSSVMCAGSPCGIKYTFAVGLSCSWGPSNNPNANHCSQADAGDPEPALPSDPSRVYQSPVNGSFSNAGTCSTWATGPVSEGFSISGDLFGIPFSYNGSILEPAGSYSPPFDGTISGAPVSRGGSFTTNFTCLSGGGGISGTYDLTVCNAGYKATGSGVCVANAVGTINVVSQNAATGGRVSASWDFSTAGQNGAPPDPCSTGSCTNVSNGTYSNARAGIYQLNPLTYPSGYVLRSIEKSTVAQVANPVVAFFEGLINQAKASLICGLVNSVSAGCSASSPALAIVNAGDTITFTIDWTPVGTIDANPTTVNLTNSSPSAQVGISDTNGTPGSVVNNLSVEQPITYTGPASGWLSIPDLSGITLNQGANPTEVTFSAASIPSACSSGCTAEVVLQGLTAGDQRQRVDNHLTPITININGGSGGGGGGSITVSINPTSANVKVGNTQAFTGTASDSGDTITWSLSGSGCSGATCGTLSSASTPSGGSVTYTAPATVPSPATVSVTATSAVNPNKSASAAVTVYATPTVSLTSNASSVNLGDTATLTWTSTNANTCAATSSPAEGDWSWNGTQLNGSEQVQPLAVGTETYTLTCSNAGASANAHVALSVIKVSCTIGASPTTVVVPGTTTISYNCTNVPVTYSCSLTDQNGASYSVNMNHGGVVSGTDMVTPTVNTQYTIKCFDPGNLGSQASATVPVNVTNPGQGECPPQGCTP